MNNKSSYIKRVYRTVPFKAGYWFDPDHSLGKDFYPVNVVASCSLSRFKLEYYDITYKTLVTAWKDKHGNVIVRYMLINKQTKIDFEDVQSDI